MTTYQSIFQQIRNIPRPSHHEERIADYLCRFAEEHHLTHRRDAHDNVVIEKPASPGYEDHEAVVILCHMDMVCVAEPGKASNPLTDPIETVTYSEGGHLWMKADGTSLGADNGIGVATAMAILADKNVVHPPLEAFFTVDEETGMYGAFALEGGWLQGKTLLNLDSESEGELYMGCAGGVDTTATFRYVPVPVEDGDIALRVRLSGCKGGHSGCDIHLQRANANKLLFRFLKEAVSNYEARLACVQGGSLRNAIPREAEAVITIPADAYDDLMNLVDDYETLFVTEFEGVEDAISLTAEQIDCPKTEMPEEVQDYLIHAITICPHGVFRMMTEMPDIVETSNNLAMIEFSREGEETVIKVQCLTRSAVESRKRELREIIHSAFSIAGADVAFTGDYPGWKPNINSRIMHTMKAIYEREFKTEPRIVIIHAGLECGIIGRNYPGMDMISFGPTIEHPHSPDERVNIATVQKFYDFLLATLKEL